MTQEKQPEPLSQCDLLIKTTREIEKLFGVSRIIKQNPQTYKDIGEDI